MRASRLVLGLWFLVGCGGGGIEGSGGDAGGGDGPGSIDGAGTGGVVANAGPDRSVLAGMRVPLGGTSQGTAFAWTQTAGPTLAIEDPAAATTFVTLPTDAPDGTTYELSLTASRPDDGDRTDTVAVSVIPTAFVDYLADIDDTAQLGTSEGIVVIDGTTWVVSTNGFVSRFDGAAFGARFDTGGQPVGMNLAAGSTRAAPTFVIADAQNPGRVVTLDTATGDVTPVFTQLQAGGDVGPANYPLVRADGTIFVSTRVGGTVVKWDPVAEAAAVWWTAPPSSNPNALAWNPRDPDAVYVGIIGRVVRVPIEADGTSGAETTYVDGFDSEADGLVWDEGGNLWIGLPNVGELKLANPSADGLTATIVRTWDGAPAAIDGFVNTAFDVHAGTTYLSWTNLGARTVGRLEVGLASGTPPIP